MPRPLEIHPLGRSALGFADRLVELVGWNQKRSDWVRLMNNDPGGCFLAKWNGQPAGTVTTIRYPHGLAWIGMMLVHPEFRRRGIASALMERAMTYLQDSDVTCIKLDATTDGEPIYARLGFQVEWPLSRWRRTPGAMRDIRSKELTPIVYRYSEIDSKAFGDNRREWLKRLAAEAKRAASFADENGRIQAYGILREGMRADYLGPIVGADPAAAEVAARHMLSGLNAERDCFWDFPDANQSPAALAKETGFKPVRHLVRMWTGDRLISGDPAVQFGTGDLSTG